MRLKKLESVTCLYVTATMTDASRRLNADRLKHIHRTQGFSSIAVHFVIDRSGRIENGRDTNYPGCLAHQRNNCSLQVALIGGVDSATLSPVNNFTVEQRRALRSLQKELAIPVVFDSQCPMKTLEDN